MPLRAQVQVTQRMPITPEQNSAEPYRQVKVSLTLECAMEPLTGLLHDLEYGQPFLFVDHLSIRRQTSAPASGGAGRLQVNLLLRGYLQPANGKGLKHEVQPAWSAFAGYRRCAGRCFLLCCYSARDELNTGWPPISHVICRPSLQAAADIDHTRLKPELATIDVQPRAQTRPRQRSRRVGRASRRCADWRGHQGRRSGRCCAWPTNTA